MNRHAPLLVTALWNQRTSIALAVWVAVILAAGILPLHNYAGHAHWKSIEWTLSHSYWHSRSFYFDVVANVGLFYPFGLLLERQVKRPDRKAAVLLSIGIGCLLSTGIEFFQVFCHNRHPSPYDIMSNTTGTALGVWTATQVFSFPLMQTLLPSAYSRPTGS